VRCRAPAHPTGTFDVTATNALGTVVLSNAFTYTLLARVQVVSGGCSGNYGALQNFVGGSLPLVDGSQFRSSAANARPNASGFFLAGNETPPYSIIGCVGLIDPLTAFIIPMQASPYGTAVFPVALPANPALAGFTFMSQWAFADATAPRGLLLSNGIRAPLRLLIFSPEVPCPMALLYRLPETSSMQLSPKSVRVLVSAVAFGCALFAQDPRFSVLGEGSGNELGRTISGGYDVNGDGRLDWIAGARGSAASTFPGKRYLYSGSGALLHTFIGQSAGDELGAAVALSPDLDGDGIGEVLVGSRYANGAAGNDCGRLTVYRGGTWTPLATIEGVLPGENLGASVAVVGDQDGDGKADFAVGVPCLVNGTPGRVEVRSGRLSRRSSPCPELKQASGSAIPSRPPETSTPTACRISRSLRWPTTVRPPEPTRDAFPFSAVESVLC
jgi:hypothetical protein